MKAKKQLIEKLSINEANIIHIPIDKKGCIEDIFSDKNRADFEIKATNEKSKTIVAQIFHDKVIKGEITVKNLDNDTKTNIESIFNELKKLLD